MDKTYNEPLRINTFWAGFSGFMHICQLIFNLSFPNLFPYLLINRLSNLHEFCLLCNRRLGPTNLKDVDISNEIS